MTASDASPTTRWPAALARGLRRHEVRLVFAVFVVTLLVGLFDAGHNYWENPRASAVDVVRQTSLLGILAVGAAVVIISGGIDLSSGSVVCFGGSICATTMLLVSPEAMLAGNISTGMAVAGISAAIVAGLLIGSLHAWLVTTIGLPPFVATLATLVGLRSLARAIVGSATTAVIGGSSSQINVADQDFNYLATSVWIPAVVFLAISAVCWLGLSKTVLGRHLYALGGNEQAARLSGIRTDRLKWFAYCVNAVLCSLAGVLYTCDVSVADPNMLGRGYELNAIAAAVVGGCSLAGGVGTISGTVLGTLFLRVVFDGVAKIIKSNADVYEGLIVGIVVVFAVALTQTKKVAGRRDFFRGALGAVTIVNLALLSGAITAIIGPTLLGSAPWLQTVFPNLSGFWLGLLALVGVGVGLLLPRVSEQVQVRRAVIAGWFVVLLGVAWWIHFQLPGWRVANVRADIARAGGTLTPTEGGTILDFTDAPLDDQQFRAIIPNLPYLPPVVELHLEGTRITDKGLIEVKQLTDLKRLHLARTSVTKVGLRAAARALPDVEIVP